MLKLIITYSLVAACTWLVMTHEYGAPPERHCRQLRANRAADDVFSFHNVEQATNLSAFMNVTFTKLDSDPPFAGIPNHYRYRVTVRLYNSSSLLALAGWMFQMRDCGSKGGNFGQLLNGTIRGHTLNISDCSASALWTCPSRANDSLILPNGVTHSNGAYTNAATTPDINEVTFEWAPVTRNETTGAYYTDIPKCGKLVGTVMLKGSLNWWHALDSRCLISWVQPGVPVDCSVDSCTC